MLVHGGVARTDNSEETRALLQARVALFWKVTFFIILLSSGLGMVGVVARPRADLILTLASAANAGLFWMLCRRGTRSIAFSRRMEALGLLINVTIGAFIGRYLVAGFAKDHAIATAQAAIMADGYVSMLQQGGTAMLVAIRAALVPSRPRRTALLTAIVGIPVVIVPAFLMPAGSGLTLRSLDSGAFPWLPGMTTMMWGFAVLTCTVITWVIYGLRREVSEARRSFRAHRPRRQG